MTRFVGPNPAGPGREYRLREILSAGWRQFRANWGRAISYAMLLMVLGLVAGFVFGLVGVLLALAMSLGAGLVPGLLPQGLSPFIVGFVPAMSALVGIGVFHALFSQGFLWSTVVSFPAGRLYWDDILEVWRRPWRWRMVAYALISTLLSALLGATGYGVLGVLHMGPVASAVRHFPLPAVPVFVLCGIAANLFQHAALLLLTLLVAPIMLRSGAPRLWRAWGEHFRIVRGQLRRVITVVGVAAAAKAVFWVAWVLSGAVVNWASAGATDVVRAALAASAYILYLLASALFSLSYSFVVAALFRTVYGLPITADAGPVPAEERLEEVDLSALRPAQRSDGTAPSADDA